jgi:predicted PurR-regulated permease PerM
MSPGHEVPGPPAPGGAAYGATPAGEEQGTDSPRPHVPPPTTSLTTPAASQQRRPGSAPDDSVHFGLRVAAGYAWRLVVVAVAVYLVFVVVGALAFVAVAVFAGLVITALLRPAVDVIARAVPRGLAVLTALLLTALALGGVVTFIANSVAGQSARLSAQFGHGVADLERSLAGAPLHLRAVDLSRLGEQARTWVTANTASLAGQALGGAGVAVELLTGLVLAVFCSIFFLGSGDRIWAWVSVQVGGGRHRWDAAARAAWVAFAGYTRGVVIIAATNAVLVCLALLMLRVPLALPLALLVFFAAFIPLVGSPIALAVATLVALAARGPLTAVLVVALTVVIGQFEGHVLQPLVMSRAVNLHPLAVVLSVASGTVLGGVIGAVVAVPLVAVAWRTWTVLRVPPDGGPGEPLSNRGPRSGAGEPSRPSSSGARGTDAVRADRG